MPAVSSFFSTPFFSCLPSRPTVTWSAQWPAEGWQMDFSNDAVYMWVLPRDSAETLPNSSRRSNTDGVPLHGNPLPDNPLGCPGESMTQENLDQGDMPLDPSIERLIQLLVESAYRAARLISAQPCNTLIIPDDDNTLDDTSFRLIGFLVDGKFGQLFNQAVTTRAQPDKRRSEFYDRYIKQRKEKILQRRQALDERHTTAAAPYGLPDGHSLAPPSHERFRPAQAPPIANSEKIKARVRAVSSKVAEIHKLTRELEQTLAGGIEIDSLEEAAMEPNDLHSLLRALAAET
ncbi:hypothetical protein C8R47DRAFT_1318135 [Mycena vitilis]|nr:hypothetical protein C8R47DRAFT_1318135 [Mycena vitilis]